MKLFLASAINNTLPLLKALLPNVGKRVLFITNAADSHDDKHFVDWDRNAFRKQGYQLTEIDLRKIDSNELKKLISENDILHVCGGSVYYLMSLLKTGGFDEVIKEAIQAESIIYTGTSAGSIIVSKSIKPFSYDEEEADHIEKISNHAGLGIINFGIMPHCDNADFVEENKKVVEHMPKDLEPLFFIKDTQAVWIENDCIKFLDVEEIG